MSFSVLQRLNEVVLEVGCKKEEPLFLHSQRRPKKNEKNEGEEGEEEEEKEEKGEEGEGE